MLRSVALTTVLLLGNLNSAFCCAGQTNGAASSTRDHDITLIEVLVDLGTRSGVTFTIEEAVAKDGVMDHLRHFKNGTLSKGSELKPALDFLVQTVPNFSYRSDPHNPKIIHIIDDRLIRRPGYALDQVVDNLEFSGRVGELVDAIARKGVPISSMGPFDASELMFTDFRSTLQLKGTGLVVRDILSDFISLTGRGPILWFAQTALEGSDTTTYVRFQGAPSENHVPKP